MANKRVSELNELLNSQVAAGDLFLIADVSAIESKRIQASELRIYSLNGTASWATNAVTASHSLTALSSSWSPNTVSASYALSASYADWAKTASYVLSASYALSSSYALTSSFSITASFAMTSSVQLVVSSANADYADSSSYLIYTAGFNNGTASAAISSSWARIAQSASFLVYVAGTPNGTASFAMSASNAISSSFLRYAGTPNGTASYAITALTASTAATVLNITLPNVYREFDILTCSYHSASLGMPTTASFGWVQFTGSYGNSPKVIVEAYGDLSVPITQSILESGSLRFIFESFGAVNNIVDTATLLHYFTGSSVQNTGSIIQSFYLKGQFTAVATGSRYSGSVHATNGLTFWTGSRGVRCSVRANIDNFVDE